MINRIYANLSKIPVGFFWVAIGSPILIFMWKCKSTKIGKTILNMKNKVGGLILTDFKIYFKTAVTKKEWCWCLDRHIEQWNRRVIPERDPPVCG